MTKWYERNVEVAHIHFSRLRDVREFLQALLTSDPLPEVLKEAVPPDSKAHLRRARPGEYEISLPDHDPPIEGTLQRKDGDPGWEFCDRLGSVQEVYVNLNDARMYAATDMVWLHHHGRGLWASSDD